METYLENDSSPGFIMMPEFKVRKLGNDAQALIASAQEAPSLMEILKNLTTPCLIYIGEAEFAYQQLREVLEQLSAVRFFSLPGLGHGQAFRYSYQVVPSIKQFLQEVTPPAEAMIVIVRRLIQQINQGNLDSLDQFFGSNWTMVGKSDLSGPAGVQQLLAQLFHIFADAEVAIESITTHDDTVITHWTFRGTQTGAWNGIQPTGERVKLNGSTVDRVENGKIVESRYDYDHANLQRQLGIDEST